MPLGISNPAAANYLPATTTAPVVGATKYCDDNAGNAVSRADPAGNMSTVSYNADGTPATAGHVVDPKRS